MPKRFKAEYKLAEELVAITKLNAQPDFHISLTTWSTANSPLNGQLSTNSLDCFAFSVRLQLLF
jgi:hypothetical protein